MSHDSIFLHPLTTSQVDKRKSGKLGERVTNDMLVVSRRLGDFKVLAVTWLNGKLEIGLPYDFKLLVRRDGSVVPESIYLEVKATSNPDKEQFQLSCQEMSAAYNYSDQYHLLVVFHQGTWSNGGVSFVHLADLRAQLRKTGFDLLIDLATLLN